MPIPPRFRERELYHFLHLDNLPGVLRDGFLSPNEQRRQGVGHTSVAAQDIQRVRARMPVPCGPGGVVHDYVPLYFCQLSSMFLSVVNSRNFDQQLLIFFAFPITILDDPNAVFTDAAANIESDPPAFYNDVQQLERLNWAAIDTLRWSAGSDELNHARMAEGLIHHHLDPRRAVGVAVWNRHIGDLVRAAFHDAGVPVPNLRLSSKHFVTRFWEDSRSSTVTGPRLVRQSFDAACAETISRIGASKSAPCSSLWKLRDALRQNPACLTCVAELIGLAYDNSVHAENVGDHTLTVVRNLRGSPEFNRLTPNDQLLTEIAAYLHDVGKGPKSRWANNRGVARHDPDHPVQALPMVVDVLTNSVATLKHRSAKVILKLVCYHDLIGEIIGKGRHEQQLLDIIESEAELDMLIALSKADVSALNDAWWDSLRVDQIRQRVVAHLSQ